MIQWWLSRLSGGNPFIRMDTVHPGDGSGFFNLGFFDTNGPGNSLIVDAFNKETWKVNVAGAGPGSNSPAQGSGWNWRRISSTQGKFNEGGDFTISGIYANAAASGSGTILVRWLTPEAAPQVSGFQIQNAELWAYQNSGTFDAPTGAEVYAFEIIPSGLIAAESPARTNSTWTQLTGKNGPLALIDRLHASGFPSGLPSGLQKDYVIGISARGTTGGAKTFKFALILEYF